MNPFARNTMLRALLAASALSTAFPALAADRVALVIGNSAYETQNQLSNPVNDAADVAAMLRGLGFEVVEAANVDRRGFDRKIREFRDKLQDSQVALLYYAGHGMQVDGRNFLIPVDARIEKAGDVDLDAIDLNVIMVQMRAEGRVNIFILDACRDNPFSRSVSRSAGPGSRAAETAFGGLAEVKSSVGSHIIFATDPGNTASDGAGRNSPFTSALLNNAVIPGIDLSRLMMKVRFDVIRATQSKQVPWESSSLLNPVYLAGEEPDALVRQAMLSPGGGQTRLAAPGAPAQPPAGAKPAQPPAEDAGALCDKFASDKNDPLRSKSVPVVRNVDLERAVPACEKAVEKSPATLRYANQLGRAYVDASRHEDALRVFRAAADRGSAYATNEIGAMTYRGWGGMQRNYPAARLWFEKAAQLGVPVAMANLGYMFAHGIGGDKDLPKSHSWYKRGVALGDSGSMNGLAYLHFEGLGTPKDLAKARELFEKTAAMEDTEGMLALGGLARQGLAGPRDFEEARRLYEMAAAAGEARAMSELGLLFRAGNVGFPVDFKLAREWFARAAKLNDSTAFLGLGMLYRDGSGVDRDMVKARENFEKAATFDLTIAMRLLADMHLEGALGMPDRDAAVQWLRRAIDLDDDDARDQMALLERPETPGEICDRLAAIPTDPLRPPSVKPVVSVNGAKAAPACEAAAAAAPADARTLNQLGRAYIDLDQYADARRVYEKAASLNSAFAALWMGNIFDRGLDVAKDHKLSLEWYGKAAALGSVDAMNNLGVAYENGDGAPRDPGKARIWYERAAALNSPSSLRNLAALYYAGSGVRRDYTIAREFYEKAAALGDARSMNQLGVIFENGRGIAKNGKAARQWYGQAAEAGNTPAMISLAGLYTAGLGGALEPQKARGLLEQAAGADNTAAMTKLAEAHLTGVFGEPDETEARRWLTRAVELGSDTARAMLAENTAGASGSASQGDVCDRLAGDKDDPLRSISAPVPAGIDAPKAIPACLAALAASPDTLRYANQLGRAYVKADRYFDAMRVYRAAADKGSAFAMLWVGNLHDRGLGTPKDPAQAALWYEKAAENGFAVAAYNAGVYHFDLFNGGKDRDKNGPAALKWFEQAAALAQPEAMYQLSIIHRDGDGVPADAAKELEWLEKAAEFGYGPGLNNLAMKYLNGDGVVKNENLAREMFQRAEAAGTKNSKLNLAHLYLNGIGGQADLPKARKLLEEAAEKEETGAIVYLAQALDAGSFGKREPEEARRLLRLASDLGSDKAKKLLLEMK